MWTIVAYEDVQYAMMTERVFRLQYRIFRSNVFGDYIDLYVP